MNEPDLIFENDQLVILRETADRGFRLQLKGSIDELRPGLYLDPLFERIHNEAIAERCTQVEVDLTSLRFLNSSGIKAIVKWIARLTGRSSEDAYRIRFIYSPEVTWQPIAVNAFPYLNPALIETTESADLVT